jgi:two-component system, sensor histidine kinase LadS
MTKLPKYFSVILLLFYTQFLLAQNQANPLILHDLEDNHSLTPFLEVLVDEKAQFSFDEVRYSQKFGQLNEKTNYKATTHWLRFQVKNQSKLDEDFKISLAFTDSVDFYSPLGTENYKKTQSGDLYPIEKRDVEVGQIVFLKLYIPRGATQTFYMRLHSSSSISQSFKVQALKSLRVFSEEVFTLRFDKARLYQALFYGGLFIMLFYNLVIFFSLRSISYLYYVVYILLVIVFLASNSGYLVEIFLPNSPRTDLYIRFLTTPLLMLAYLTFSQSYLKVSQYSKKYALIINTLQVLLLVCGLAMVAGFWSVGRLLVIILAILSFLYILFLAFYVFRKGYSPARYFIAANLLLIFGGVLYAFPRFVGVVDNPITQYSVQISVVFQVAIFSLGLADSINLIRKQLAENILLQERQAKEQEAERNRLIADQNRQLEIKVVERTAEVVEQKELIEQKNKKITDSIRYAKRIQQAILGSEVEVTQRLGEAFLYFSPKDIVSGDFYWISSPKNDADERIVMAAADCTGHGVPGAFMTMLGNALLNEIVDEDGITQPNLVLAELDKRLINLLQKQVSDFQIADGMDIVVLCIDKKANAVEISAALNPMYYVRNNEIVEIKGSKFPIGGSHQKEAKVFGLQTISTQSGDCFYIFSDGYQDQFSSDGQKFMKKRMREYILSIHNLPMKTQHQQLAQTIETWKGDKGQTDDILVIGFRVG